MTTVESALQAYNASVFGPRSKQSDVSSVFDYLGRTIYIQSTALDPERQSAAHGIGPKVLISLTVLVATCTGVVFAAFAIDAFAASISLQGKECDGHDEEIGENIRAVYSGLSSERALAGTANLCAAIATALLITSIVFAVQKRGYQLELNLSASALLLLSTAFFAGRQCVNPRPAANFLRDLTASPADWGDVSVISKSEARAKDTSSSDEPAIELRKEKGSLKRRPKQPPKVTISEGHSSGTEESNAAHSEGAVTNLSSWEDFSPLTGSGMTGVE